MRVKMKFIWTHEICGGAPVHPKTWICMQCHTPVFPDECIKVKVSDKWLNDHPQAHDYLVESNKPLDSDAKEPAQVS